MPNEAMASSINRLRMVDDGDGGTHAVSNGAAYADDRDAAKEATSVPTTTTRASPASSWWSSLSAAAATATKVDGPSVRADPDHRYLKELNGICGTSSDCRDRAYVCRHRRCQCATGYRPDARNQTCIGGIDSRCMYDAHCIPNAFCRGQTICTCMTEYPFAAPDKWSCEDAESMADDG